MTLMAAVWCAGRKHASLRRRAVLYSSSVGGVQQQRGVPGMLPVLQPGRCRSCPWREFKCPAVSWTTACFGLVCARLPTVQHHSFILPAIEKKKPSPPLCDKFQHPHFLPFVQSKPLIHTHQHQPCSLSVSVSLSCLDLSSFAAVGFCRTKLNLSLTRVNKMTCYLLR